VKARVKKEVPPRTGRLALYHANRESRAGERKRAKGLLIEALFRHLLYGNEGLSEEWDFLDKKGADSVLRAGKDPSQVAKVLKGTGGMTELLSFAEPTDVLDFACVEKSNHKENIFAGLVPPSFRWEACAVTDQSVWICCLGSVAKL
jgi:hypothetical protein